MAIDRESGKDRWRRVPKDYFKHPDALRRTRLRLAVVAALAALGWWASGLDWSQGGTTANEVGRYRASRGPVARVHAAWDNRCDACHVPFAPVDGRPLLPVGRRSDPGRMAGTDALCSSCHKVGVHHQTTIATEVPGCAECHRDHKGREASLVRLADTDCTRCHGQLSAHQVGGAAKSHYGNVHRFDQDHPPFRPEAARFDAGKPPEDRSRLKFNHALHMRAGLTARPGDVPFTAQRIPVESERARYQGRTASDPVRLECASCHTPEPAESGTRAGGSYQSVTFATSCRACHALSFDPRQPSLMAPHGVSPPEVAAFVRQTYAAQFLTDDPTLLAAYTPSVTIPGSAPEARKIRDRLDDAVATAESLLFENATNCRECHHLEGQDHGVVPARVEPTNVPKIWFSHARFDHSAHRAVSCRDCHARAYADQVDGTPLADASTVNTDLLLPDLANCRTCHGPDRATSGWFSGTGGKSSGKASQDCVECHRYHDGDRSTSFPGALVRDETTPHSIAEFLSGAAQGPRSSSRKE